jgi:nucleoside diphosphate kinase
MILGAVTDIAVDFVKQKKPRGIILGTKETANPARGRIYKMLARSASKNTGGVVHEIDNPRTGMANGVMVWFDDDNPFRLLGFPDSSYQQKA